MSPKGKQVRNRLWLHRQRMGLSQSEVAEILKINSSMLSRWESGETTPSCINLLKLSILYNTFILELYREVHQDLREELQQKTSQAKPPP